MQKDPKDKNPCRQVAPIESGLYRKVALTYMSTLQTKGPYIQTKRPYRQGALTYKEIMQTRGLYSKGKNPGGACPCTP